MFGKYSMLWRARCYIHFRQRAANLHPAPPVLCFQDQALEDKWEARESARRRDLILAQTDYSKVRTLFSPLSGVQ